MNSQSVLFSRVTMRLFLAVLVLLSVFGQMYSANPAPQEVVSVPNSRNIQLPLITLGTKGIKSKDKMKKMVEAAFNAKYRSFDTASSYGNEKALGTAIKMLLPKFKLTREEIFITTKIAVGDMGPRAYSAVLRSLKNLNTPYIDLYLIEYPSRANSNQSVEALAAIRLKTWEELMKAQREGLVKAIGVSNYAIAHLEELLDNYSLNKPAVNQIEWHPFYHPADIKYLCERYGILVQAHTVLGGGKSTEILDHPQIKMVAEKLNVSNAQVLLKWVLQQDIPLVVRSTNPEHLMENANLDFKFSLMDYRDLSVIQPSKKFTFDPDNLK